FAVRGGILDLYPATAERAVRVDLFEIEIESLREFSTFTQRSLAELDEVLIAPAAELAAEHRELAEIAASSDEEDRPDVAELLPLDRFGAFLDLVPPDSAVLVAAHEDISPALHDHWTDVCAAFHDSDAHGLYVTPDAIEAALEERVKVRLGTISGAQPFEFRAQAADTAARALKEAEPELEKLVRSGYRTLVTWGHKGDGERVAYNLARLRAVGEDEAAGPRGGAGARGRAAQRLRRAPPPGGLRAPRGRRVAHGVRGEARLHRDARPARGDRARQDRHGGAAADGPPHLRRR